MKLRPQHFRALWPITDPSMTLAELANEALPDLEAITHRSRVQAIGRPRWCIRPGRDVPGSGGAEQVLIADLAVVAIPRNTDAITGETEYTQSTRYARPVDSAVGTRAQKPESEPIPADGKRCNAPRMDETRPGEAA